MLNTFNKEGILTFNQAQKLQIVPELEHLIDKEILSKDTIVGQQLTRKYATCVRIIPTDRLDEILEAISKKEKQLDVLNYLLNIVMKMY